MRSNGISTSHFSLSKSADNKVAITLNNFCKLQDLGADDRDDIRISRACIFCWWM